MVIHQGGHILSLKSCNRGMKAPWALAGQNSIKDGGIVSTISVNSVCFF